MIDQIHASHISMFTRCGEQFRFRYIEEIVIPPGVALLTGTATHAAIEKNMKNKIETGALLSLEEVRSEAHDALHTAWSERGCALTEEERARGEVAVRGEAADMAVRLVTLHQRELAPKIKPAAVERAWVVELDGYPVNLGGRIDLQEQPELRPVGRVRDTKTAGKAPSPNQSHQMIQLTVYATAVNVLDGDYPELAVDYLVKGKTPKAVTQETVRDVLDTETLLRRVETMCLALERGVFIPTSTDNWWCGPRFCGYADRCKYYRRGSK